MVIQRERSSQALLCRYSHSESRLRILMRDTLIDALLSPRISKVTVLYLTILGIRILRSK